MEASKILEKIIMDYIAIKQQMDQLKEKLINLEN